MADKFKACSVDDCNGNGHYSAQGRKGLCSLHYKRLWRHGDPLGGITKNGEPMQFIIDFVIPYKGEECLSWPFAKIEGGRGRIYVKGKLEVASRYVCELAHGAPPTPKHEAAHSCGNGHLGCVNPNHLSWKTRLENKADELLHGTRNRGERQGLSKLKKSEVLEILSLKGTSTQTEIASKYGVSRSRISEIHNRKAWAWLSE